LADDGADFIDIGGESTRPGSEPVAAQEEIRRVIHVIEKLVTQIRIPISIDTYKSEVAEAALDAGAVVVNDISAAT
jgi:dihydropteroate synthase